MYFLGAKVYVSVVQKGIYLVYQVNVWGFVDSKESSIVVFLEEVDKSEAVRKRCWGHVIGSGLEHGQYFSFDRSEEWRRCWGVWHSGDDIKFFESGQCEFRIESWRKIKYLFGFGLVDRRLPMSSFWVSDYDNGNLRCHKFGISSVIIEDFGFGILGGFLLHHFRNMWPVPTLLP